MDGFVDRLFAHRRLVYSADPSIERWFEDANALATKDQEKELLVVTTYVTHGLRHTDKLLHVKKDRPRAKQSLIETAFGVAATSGVVIFPTSSTSRRRVCTSPTSNACSTA